MKKNSMRPAIAMIELIFALVIMGIVLLSAPMLIQTATQSGYVAIQQESINEAASQVNIILGYQWDDNNTNESHDPVVLSTTNGNTNLNEIGITGLRAGTPNESFRAFVSTGGDRGIATPIGTAGESGGIDDMDDFDGTVVNLNPEEIGGDADYIEKGTDINISSTVAYMSDDENGTGTYNDGGGGTLTFSPTFTGSETPTTNIKRIQVTLTSNRDEDELTKEITLHAFSCNIGSYSLEERP